MKVKRNNIHVLNSETEMAECKDKKAKLFVQSGVLSVAGIDVCEKCLKKANKKKTSK